MRALSPAIFLSYASQDAEAAARQQGPVWKQGLTESSPSQFVYYDSVARAAKAAALANPTERKTYLARASAVRHSFA